MKLPMFITKRALSRRTFLHGAGATLALPFLDAMAPALTAAPVPHKRLGFVYVPNGVIVEQFVPAKEGDDFEITTILKPLEAYKDQLVVISNMVRAEPSNNHAVSSGSWLTGTRPKRTDGRTFGSAHRSIKSSRRKSARTRRSLRSRSRRKIFRACSARAIPDTAART
jgi:hypothetical protein